MEINSTKPSSQAMPPGRNEIELLLSCAKRGFGGTADLSRGDIDWDRFMTLARQNGMVPLAYRALKASPDLAVPQAVMDGLKEGYLQNVKRSLRLESELLRILASFKDNGIEAIPFKGCALAQQIYGDPAMRQFGDLDIIVHGEDVLKAKSVLMSRGYSPESVMSQEREKRLLKSNCEYSFCSPMGVCVEVHWGLAPKYYYMTFDENGIWSRVRSINLGGKKVLCLSPEDQIVALTIHGSKHLWEGLKLVCDLAGLIEREIGLDWNDVVDYAICSRSKRSLLLGLLISEELLGSDIPAHLSNEARQIPAIRDLSSSAIDGLFSTEKSGFYEKYTFWPRTLDGNLDRAKHIWHRLMDPNSADYMAIDLPDAFYSAYYLVRPLNLVYRFGWKRTR
ncbi:MAG TPA: nucleotidyltransferase family protein [Methanotrichaceae archaeon]|nr:nucleotidyltransferase family protein [Methanotrichaceae archaeon]